MPGLSNWKIPSVLPARKSSNVASSLSGRLLTSKEMPVPALIEAWASSMTVRLRRPSRSILSRPRASTSFIGYWVVTSPLTD